jgi:hypothetical protein
VVRRASPLTDSRDRPPAPSARKPKKPKTPKSVHAERAEDAEGFFFEKTQNFFSATSARSA